MCELRLAKALGYIEKVPHFNSINNYMRNEEMTAHLHRVYKTLAMPLVSIEGTFAVDATGISNRKKIHWVDYRLQKRVYRDWKKLHITSGVLSGIVTAARVTESKQHDSLHFEHLVRQTSENFKILEVCADSGYLSRANAQLVEDVGGTPYIMMKSNIRLTHPMITKRAVAWKKMIRLWRDHRELFLQHYHQRSNVESTFSAIKRKFLPYVRSKDDTAQINEILCKNSLS